MVSRPAGSPYSRLRCSRNFVWSRLNASYTGVCARSGVHPTEISRIENGQRDVQITTIFKLAKAFDLTPGQFIDGT